MSSKTSLNPEHARNSKHPSHHRDPKTVKDQGHVLKDKDSNPRDHHSKHPPLREAVIKAAGNVGHVQQHGRARAGTLTRRDTTQVKTEHDRHSVGKQSDVHPPSLVDYENTYRLEPDSRFQESKVQEIIATVLTTNLPEKTYDPRIMGRRCLELSEIIKEKVKQLQMWRFKVVCMVIIGQICDQSMVASSRCVWNFNYDNFATFTLKRSAYYAVGMVFATYAE